MQVSCGQAYVVYVEIVLCRISTQVCSYGFRNRNEIKITTPPVPSSQNVSIMLTVDGYFNDKTRFSFVADPIITGLKPNRTILA